MRSFQFLYLFYNRPNFFFYWPTLLSDSTHMNGASSERVTQSLVISPFTWNYLYLRTNCFVRSITTNQNYRRPEKLSIRLCVIFNQHWGNCIFEEQCNQCCISKFFKILSLKSFCNSWGNSCIEFYYWSCQVLLCLWWIKLVLKQHYAEVLLPELQFWLEKLSKNAPKISFFVTTSFLLTLTSLGFFDIK